MACRTTLISTFIDRIGGAPSVEGVPDTASEGSIAPTGATEKAAPSFDGLALKKTHTCWLAGFLFLNFASGYVLTQKCRIKRCQFFLFALR